MNSKLLAADLLGLPPASVVTDPDTMVDNFEDIEAGSIFPAFLSPENPVEFAMVHSVKLTPKISPILEEPMENMGDFESLKIASKLPEIHVNDLILHATSSAIQHPNGTLYHDIDSFTDFLAVLYEHGRIMPPEESVVQSLFELLDHSQTGKIELVEVTAGLALFAGGSEGEKVSAVFALVDANEDGFLSRNELVDFFTLIFRNVFSKQILDALVFNGVTARTPEDLAVRTAVECMNMCDLDKDGQLSLDEFKQWFNKPKISSVF
jgi:Ca2+-binding EF-hand superfamily protein